jgi:hypothetical protein
MKKSIYIFLSFTLMLCIISCSKKRDIEKDKGVRTVLRGHVSDLIRGINISGYKIVLVKHWGYCANWMCGTRIEEVATAYTYENGDYSITFDYKLKAEERYSLYEQYYGVPYYPEYLPDSTQIIAGENNVININAWRPVELKLSV